MSQEGSGAQLDDIGVIGLGRCCSIRLLPGKLRGSAPRSEAMSNGNMIDVARSSNNCYYVYGHQQNSLATTSFHDCGGE